jgi:transcriptional regulator with XRE-family HTH domain
MGRGKRVVPDKLPAKLLVIRERLDLSQVQMFRRLGRLRSRVHSAHISGYEQGIREPPLDVLLQYARVAGVPVEVLIDDELDLPDRLPTQVVQEWVMVRKEQPL